jgi:hypothetical protein
VAAFWSGEETAVCRFVDKESHSSVVYKHLQRRTRRKRRREEEKGIGREERSRRVETRVEKR